MFIMRIPHILGQDSRGKPESRVETHAVITIQLVTIVKFIQRQAGRLNY